MESIGMRVRRERDRSLMTQAELAEKSGLTQVTISRVENDRGERRPTRATLSALADALNVDVFWLANGDDSQELKIAA